MPLFSLLSKAFAWLEPCAKHSQSSRRWAAARSHRTAHGLPTWMAMILMTQNTGNPWRPRNLRCPKKLVWKTLSASKIFHESFAEHHLRENDGHQQKHAWWQKIHRIYTMYWWVRTCGLWWDKTCLGLVLSHVSTVWSAYGALVRIATWARSFGTWDLPKLPTHVRWTRSETWMQISKNTLVTDRDFMFCDSSKGWWDRKLQWF